MRIEAQVDNDIKFKLAYYGPHVADRLSVELIDIKGRDPIFGKQYSSVNVAPVIFACENIPANRAVMHPAMRPAAV